MPAYLIRHRSGQHGDINIHDDQLDVEFGPGWIAFTDGAGVALALPADQVASIQRIDDDQAEAGDSDTGE